MIAARLEAMNNRERWLIFGAAVAVIWVLFDALAWQPAAIQQQRDKAEIETLTNETRQLDAVVEATRAALENDPNRALRVRRNALRESIESIRLQVERAAGKQFSASGASPGAVEFLLAGNPRLQLLRLEKRPAEPVELSSTVPVSGKADDRALRRHPVVVRLKGSYAAVRDFVSALATTHADVAFEKFVLRSVGYPENELALTLALYSYDDAAPVVLDEGAE